MACLGHAATDNPGRIGTRALSAGAESCFQLNGQRQVFARASSESETGKDRPDGADASDDHFLAR